jgi:hypothetical protein
MESFLKCLCVSVYMPLSVCPLFYLLDHILDALMCVATMKQIQLVISNMDVARQHSLYT